MSVWFWISFLILEQNPEVAVSLLLSIRQQSCEAGGAVLGTPGSGGKS